MPRSEFPEPRFAELRSAADLRNEGEVAPHSLLRRRATSTLLAAAMATPPGEGKATSPMEQWLREQAEKAQANRVTTNRAMCVAPVPCFGTWRTPGSDVLGIATRCDDATRRKKTHGTIMSCGYGCGPSTSTQHTA